MPNPQIPHLAILVMTYTVPTPYTSPTKKKHSNCPRIADFGQALSHLPVIEFTAETSCWRCHGYKQLLQPAANCSELESATP